MERRFPAGFRGCFAESKAASSSFAPPPPFYMRCSVGALRPVRSNPVKPGQTKTCYRLQPPRVVQSSTKHTIYEKFVCSVGALRRFRSNPVKPSQTWSNQRSGGALEFKSAIRNRMKTSHRWTQINTDGYSESVSICVNLWLQSPIRNWKKLSVGRRCRAAQESER